MTLERKFNHAIHVTRREALASLAAAPVAFAAGCHAAAPHLPPAGEIVGANVGLGHRVRTMAALAVPTAPRRQVGTLIVGGGVAGLSAAWRLERAGYKDFELVELESLPGGTARGGISQVSAFPWGAHYLPAPLADNKALLALLAELGAVERFTPAGEPVYAEQFLCRDPEERVFVEGQWHEGLFPEAGASGEDLAQWQRFRVEVERWITWRDGAGRRAFALPAERSSAAPEVAALDQISMSEWLARRGFTSPRVLWMVNYACRDDYGCTAEHMSAWAGLFYFCSRVALAGEKSQPLLTWPEGNGRLVAHMYERVKSRVRLGQAVLEISPGPEGDEAGISVTAWNEAAGETVAWQARRVIFAAPQFVAPHVIRGYQEARGAAAAQFTYGSWLVANLHLRQRPAENGFPLAWDNVLYESEGLGYVVATHQSGRDHGPTVLTYYRPLCEADIRAARAWLLNLEWPEAANLVLADLEQAHPDLRGIVERLDIMRWGHAMIRPTPGFRFGAARRSCAAPFRGVHFSHSDLSGLPLFEEAFFHGLRAAEAALSEQGVKVDSMLEC